MGKIPHKIFPLKCSFVISYGVGRNYRPIWVSVSVLDLNQNSGFGRTLPHWDFELYSSSNPNVTREVIRYENFVVIIPV